MKSSIYLSKKKKKNANTVIYVSFFETGTVLHGLSCTASNVIAFHLTSRRFLLPDQETEKNQAQSKIENETSAMEKPPARDGWRDKADRRKIKGEKATRKRRAAKTEAHPFSQSCEQISAVITNKFSTRNEVRKRERVNPKVRPKGVRSYF